MSKLAIGINMLLVSVVSGVLLYIIYQNRNTRSDVSTLMETELATRMTEEDVEEIIMKTLQKQQIRQIQQEEEEKNLEKSKEKICPENQVKSTVSQEVKD